MLFHKFGLSKDNSSTTFLHLYVCIIFWSPSLSVISTHAVPLLNFFLDYIDYHPINQVPRDAGPVVQDKVLNLAVVDTIGAEDYGRLRSYSYNESNLIVICFSISDRRSLTNVFERVSDLNTLVHYPLVPSDYKIIALMRKP